jgi:hypothetical protein
MRKGMHIRTTVALKVCRREWLNKEPGVFKFRVLIERSEKSVERPADNGTSGPGKIQWIIRI